MGHGHGPPWRRPESYAFAESIVKSGAPWCQQTKSETIDGTYHASFTSSKSVDKATLVSTTDDGVTGSRTWVKTPAQLSKQDDQWTVIAPLPGNATAWFVNVQCGDLVVSSDYQEKEAVVGPKPDASIGNKAILFKRMDSDADQTVTKTE